MSQLKSPQILTTNRLLDGTVVFFSADGWSTDIQQACVVSSEEQLQAIKQQADASVRANQVVAYYAIDVEQANGEIVPVAIREKIRVTGPTIDYAPIAE